MSSLCAKESEQSRVVGFCGVLVFLVSVFVLKLHRSRCRPQHVDMCMFQDMIQNIFLSRGPLKCGLESNQRSTSGSLWVSAHSLAVAMSVLFLDLQVDLLVVTAVAILY